MQVKITLIANAGLLIEIDGKKLLLDGLHNQQKDALFSPVPPHILQQLLEGRIPFDGIRWLYFSHLHEDHFNLELVKTFLGMPCLEKLVFPKGLCKAELAELHGDKLGTCTIHEIDTPPGTCQEMKLDQDIRVYILPAEHAGREYEGIINLCFVLCAFDRKVLFLGDADYDREFLGRILGNTCYDVIVINPLFLHLPKGRKVLTQELITKQIIVYHLPFEQDDKLHFRKMISEDMELYKEIMPPITVLKNPLDSVCIT